MTVEAPERVWRQFSVEVEQYRGKRVRGELVLGRRFHFLVIGTVEVLGPDHEGRYSVTLLMPTPYKPGHQNIFVLDERELRRLKPTGDPDYDFFFRGSLNCSGDPNVESPGSSLPPRIVT